MIPTLLFYALSVLGDPPDLTPWRLDPKNKLNAFTPSPENWRAIPIYSLLLDKFADGDPTNNDFFGTMFEHDSTQTTFRFGGDILGLASRLDYIADMGIKCIFIMGTNFLNMPWQADGYSPIDFTLLDPHFGTYQQYVNVIKQIHDLGMYVPCPVVAHRYIMFDFTVATMGDFITSKDYVNKSTPFSLTEYEVTWKYPSYTPWNISTYPQFDISNQYDPNCTLPTFWQEDGTVAQVEHKGCYNSDFDQYGDVEAFGVHPDWMRQLGKFASVQDRLREWKPSVLEKLKTYACTAIETLDIDAIRIDKATQVTVDALAEWSRSTRQCARNVNKHNFLILGEVTGGDTFAAIYVGRGRTPDQRPKTFLQAANLSVDDPRYFIREKGATALDGVAFHYSFYRALTRFLLMDGNLEVAYDTSVNFVDAWNQMMISNDFKNADTGLDDPRHAIGLTNHDNFRWPGLLDGRERYRLGLLIASLLIPGIPLHYYGEEQDLYVFDNSASNYLFGRQPMPSSHAWQRHGCYRLGSDQYYEFPTDEASDACHDAKVSLDHFDTTAAQRRLWKRIHQLREVYPALRDGFELVQYGNWTSYISLPGSNLTNTEIGFWSVARNVLPGQTQKPTPIVWFLYTNNNESQVIEHDCNGVSWISAPYPAGSILRSLFWPYETYTLQASGVLLDASREDSPTQGCLQKIQMARFGFKALVIVDQWIAPVPSLVAVTPAHDARIVSGGDTHIMLSFDTPMDCEILTRQVRRQFSITNAQCQDVLPPKNYSFLTSPAVWNWSATTQLKDGVHELFIQDIPSLNGLSKSGRDRIMLRVGDQKDVVVHDRDYTDTALSWNNQECTIQHDSNSADSFRYSGDYGRSWSTWRDVREPECNISAFKHWWPGQHIQMEYYSKTALSVSRIVHSDSNYNGLHRRVPQYIVRGAFNRWGFDLGPLSKMRNLKGSWALDLASDWPTSVQINVFAFDGLFYGDTDNDTIIDRLPPNSAASNFINLTAPPAPYFAWTLHIDDATGRWSADPTGDRRITIALFVLLFGLSPISAIVTCLMFQWHYYTVWHNAGDATVQRSKQWLAKLPKPFWLQPEQTPPKSTMPATKKRLILMATLEYEIFDWDIKIKIGGLGVISALIGRALTEDELIWVVPKIGGVLYPAGVPSEPIKLCLFGEQHLVEVETHQFCNITYVLLTSTVFEELSAAAPYPVSMENISSAIVYSTWNQCIAEIMRRYPVDVYHINDYHGAVAPVYLLPRLMPICLMLHNAEFQGQWPLRTTEEFDEVCSAFNISADLCKKYIQYGNTFNLLHAAVAFITLHQDGVGVAGVSDKYTKRLQERYPIFWSLSEIVSVPNPDPADSVSLCSEQALQLFENQESLRTTNRSKAQAWADLEQDATADLFVFVGRWSKQKGVDLIADLWPSLLESHRNCQLICVGPIVDLYGHLAAEKLSKLMLMYPKRIYTRPEFVTIPSFLFCGADFALIPSRDEPFGLVAVEFGRKGALGIGSKVGGLGAMPGWWYPCESTTTGHLLQQLKRSIELAIATDMKSRRDMRESAHNQRFPIEVWRTRLKLLHDKAIAALSQSSSSDIT